MVWCIRLHRNRGGLAGASKVDLAKERSMTTTNTTPSARSIGSTPKTSLNSDGSQQPHKPSHQSDESYRELCVEITTPTLFKTVLLSTLPWDMLATYPLERHQLTKPIPVMVHNQITYCLKPHSITLIHLPPSGVRQQYTWYRQLFSSPGGQGSRSPFVYANDTGDFFLPLGNVVEVSGVGRHERLTNYVWALNISTDPVSLWLVFDYQINMPDGGVGEVGLREIYRNRYNEDHVYEDPFTWYAYNYAPSTGYLQLGGEWDVLKVFDDVDKDWQPENVKELHDAKKWLLGPTLRAYVLNMPPKESPGLRKATVEQP
ncbi:MAG: hypothetical protein Q9170_001388 [Blastenia crenularia]